MTAEEMSLHEFAVPASSCLATILEQVSSIEFEQLTCCVCDLTKYPGEYAIRALRELPLEQMRGVLHNQPDCIPVKHPACTLASFTTSV